MAIPDLRQMMQRSCTARQSWPLRMMLSSLLGAAVLLLGPTPAASAHATLLFATPAIDGAVPATPAQILLVFDQPVSAGKSAITLTTEAGAAIELGPTTLTGGGTSLQTPTTSRLGPGAYAVHWLVTATDGDAMQGTYHFAVGSAAGLDPSRTQATRGATLTALLRWLLFSGLALSLGGVVGARIARGTRASESEAADPKPLAVLGAALTLASAALLAVMTVGSGSLTSGLAHLSPAALAASAPARLATIELAGSLAGLLLLLGLRRPRLGFIAMLSVAVADGLRAHPQAQWPLWGALDVSVHLIAAAIWLGALVHVILVARARHRRGDPAAPLVRSYAGIAIWLLAAVILTGALNTLALIPLDQLLGALAAPGYGRWLLLKLVLVAGAVGCALFARLRLRRRCTSHPSRAVRFEAAALVAVLGISATLTVSAPPVDPNAPLPFPPAASGPIYSAGARAGWIGIGASASSGQLLVRLTAPELAGRTDSSQDYALAGNVTFRGRSAEVRFRRCGVGCFVAPTAWARGDNTVTLHVEHTGDLAGGTAALTVAWPPRPAPAILRKVVAAMRDVRQFDVHERVTSDTNQEPLAPTILHMSGQDFLDSDPYNSGNATTVNVLARDQGETTLALGFPGDDTCIELTVDRDFRIVRETLTGPDHQVQRTFVYPSAERH